MLFYFIFSFIKYPPAFTWKYTLILTLNIKSTTKLLIIETIILCRLIFLICIKYYPVFRGDMLLQLEMNIDFHMVTSTKVLLIIALLCLLFAVQFSFVYINIIFQVCYETIYTPYVKTNIHCHVLLCILLGNPVAARNSLGQVKGRSSAATYSLLSIKIPHHLHYIYLCRSLICITHYVYK